jgi:hypothetical protein
MHVSVGHPGSRNDKTIVKTDEFLQKIKNKEILHDVEFQLFRQDGTSFLVLGAYLLTDNGYARWRMMQCPIKSSFNISELMWSTRLESVRKDVECTFGILKIRFRILGGSVNFHDQWKVDNVFVACCILHNMNLTEDENNLVWSSDQEWGIVGAEDDDDADLMEGKMLVDLRRSREQRRISARIIPVNEVDLIEHVVIAKERNIIVENEDEPDDDYYTFRSQLIEHYMYCKEVLKSVEWAF